MMTYEEQMKKAKEGLSSEEILNNHENRVCNFSRETIKDYAMHELKEQGKVWNDLQIDILAEGVENSDWLKIQFDTESLSDEIIDWIHRLEEEWEEDGNTPS